MGLPVKAPQEDSQASLTVLSTADPTSFLTPSAPLSIAAREVLQDLFGRAAESVLAAQTAARQKEGKETLFPKLHAVGFDLEQIWMQLDLQAGPVLSILKKRINKSAKHFGGETDALPRPFMIGDTGGDTEERLTEAASVDDMEGEEGDVKEMEGFDEFEAKMDGDGEEDLDEDDDSAEDRPKKDGKKQSNATPAKKDKLPFEDKFLTVEGMERFLEAAEAREGEEEERMEELYHAGNPLEDDEDEEEGEEDDEDENMDGGVNLFTAGGEEEEDEIRYEDFFGTGPETSTSTAGREKQKKRRGVVEQGGGGEDGEADEEEDREEGGEGEADGEEDGDVGEEEGEGEGEIDESKMSGFEKKQVRLKKRIEELEQVNLNPKGWTMQGEVTAGSRPKNSALEVEMEFEHAARPPPVITEEVTATLEDLIKNRILEARYDDVERKEKTVARTPKERIELDDNRSQRGLAEIYEAEYAEHSGLAPAAASSSEAIKREAAVLFKELCGKLDALSHFHFAPKPVVEEMGIRADVAAVAMEEVAPMAVSDKSLLAPEEVFKGGDGEGGARGNAAGGVKAEGEMTHEERRRRHAKNKRKRKAELHAKGEKGEVPGNFTSKRIRGSEGEAGQRSTEFTKSSKLFARLQDAKEGGGEKGKPSKVERR